MKKNSSFKDRFYANGVFHVYNRTNNKEFLFRSDENKRYFLSQYHKFLNSFVDTLCWNLLDTHFHFLIKVKDTDFINGFLKRREKPILTLIEKEYLKNKNNLNGLITSCWRRLFTSYAMSCNKMYGRKGNLFHRPFCRVEIEKESQFTQSILYIHFNAVHHKLCEDFALHKWSSYHSILSYSPTNLKREQVLEWFGDRASFAGAHEIYAKGYSGFEIGFEDI